MKNGLFIIDDKALLRSYGITPYMKIRVNIMKKEGCFPKNSKITIERTREVDIEKIGVGDKLISYN